MEGSKSAQVELFLACLALDQGRHEEAIEVFERKHREVRWQGSAVFCSMVFINFHRFSWSSVPFLGPNTGSGRGFRAEDFANSSFRFFLGLALFLRLIS